MKRGLNIHFAKDDDLIKKALRKLIVQALKNEIDVTEVQLYFWLVSHT